MTLLTYNLLTKSPGPPSSVSACMMTEVSVGVVSHQKVLNYMFKGHKF